jgi:hypothetical protein
MAGLGPRVTSNGHDDVADLVENGRDLSDVSTHLSMAKQSSAGFRVSRDGNNDDSQSETSSVHRFDANPSSDGSSSVKDDPHIRDMKMRGEFPCRLCPAVYPNLRALKGHNKEHLVSML